MSTIQKTITSLPGGKSPATAASESRLTTDSRPAKPFSKNPVKSYDRFVPEPMGGCWLWIGLHNSENPTYFRQHYEPVPNNYKQIFEQIEKEGYKRRFTTKRFKRSKLTPENVQTILTSNLRQVELAHRFNVSKACIHLVRARYYKKQKSKIAASALLPSDKAKIKADYYQSLGNEALAKRRWPSHDRPSLHAPRVSPLVWPRPRFADAGGRA